MWGRLAACGGLATRPERRLITGAQLDKLPHNRTSSSTHRTRCLHYYPRAEWPRTRLPMAANSFIIAFRASWKAGTSGFPDRR
jgi:hypothetical protein